MNNHDFLTFLAQQHAHPRDAAIQFFEADHRYTIAHDPNSKYTSVTTWIHTLFPEFNSDAVIDKMMSGAKWKPGHKYWGLTKAQIQAQWQQNGQAVSGDGTAMHYAIECFYNRYTWMFHQRHQQQPQRQQPDQQQLQPQHPCHRDLLALYHQEVTAPPQTKEWQYFLNFLAEHPSLVPFRTEWMLYDEELKMAGSVDMLYLHPDTGHLSIYDWKRSKQITAVNHFNEYSHQVEICHLPHANFWHYALQLNTYKQLLQRKYGCTIQDLCLIRLHPDADTYEKLVVPPLDRELEQLLQVRQEAVHTASLLEDMKQQQAPHHL